MDDYRPVTCATCNQGIYLARRLLREGFWNCPGCGAENMTLGSTKPRSVAVPPSRFARPKGPQLAPVVMFRRHKKLPLYKRIVRRAGRT